MNCQLAREHLSSFADGELPGLELEAVEQHIAACADCRSEVDRIRHLGEIARTLPAATLPDGVWSKIEGAVHTSHSDAPPPSQRRRRFALTRVLSIAAVAMVAIGLTWLLFSPERDAHHDHAAVDFDTYLQRFPDDPSGAHQVILDHYKHTQVDLSEATDLLKYQPAATATLASEYTLESAYVLDMPCCRCIQTNYSKDGQPQFAIFEHDADQPVWFGDRPAISTTCCGVETRVVQFDGLLAVSWPRGERHLTLVGARDMNQVVELVEALNADR